MVNWIMIEKYIRDPIHGYIEISPCAREIIDTPLFQRLRRVKQLSFSHLVYPGAEHSRFGHSLGVYHLAKRVNSYLLKDEKDEIKEEFCLAGLLHDIGHHPFSHSFESILNQKNKNPKINYNHENYTQQIIKNTEIGEIIENNGFSKNTVIKLLGGSYVKKPRLQFLNELISSELDLDRLDYLLRDSYYCGVPYGRVDLERLLISLKTVDGNLIITEKGKQSIEMYVLARFYMYTQVYLHHTSIALDILLQNIFGDDYWKDIKYPKPTKKEINNFINYDDNWLSTQIKNISEREDRYGDLAKRILCRNPLRMVIEKIAFSDAQTNAVPEDYSFVKALNDNLDVISQESGIPQEDIFINEPWQNLPFENRYHPYTTKVSTPIKIEIKGKIMDITQDQSSMTYNIARYMAQVIRVYTKNEHRETLKNILKTRYERISHLLVD